MAHKKWSEIKRKRHMRHPMRGEGDPVMLGDKFTVSDCPSICVVVGIMDTTDIDGGERNAEWTIDYVFEDAYFNDDARLMRLYTHVREVEWL